MNIDQYLALKAAGRANLMKVNQSYAIGWQTALPTGENGPMELQAIGREDIAKLRSSLEKQLSALDAISAEMDALDASSRV